jgi:hypothetical protein
LPEEIEAQREREYREVRYKTERGSKDREGEEMTRPILGDAGYFIPDAGYMGKKDAAS